MIRVPSQFNGTFITRHFFPRFFRHNDLQSINAGHCYDWAYYAWRLFPNVVLWTTDYHAWVQVGKKFYDSETNPKGVLNFMHLGCNRRHGPDPWADQHPVRMDVKDFQKFWNKHGGGFKNHWDSMLEGSLQKVLGKRYSERTPILHKPQPAMFIP